MVIVEYLSQAINNVSVLIIKRVTTDEAYFLSSSGA